MLRTSRQSVVCCRACLVVLRRASTSSRMQALQCSTSVQEAPIARHASDLAALRRSARAARRASSRRAMLMTSLARSAQLEQ